MDCFADDREALNDFTKYYNNAHLSDVALLVGDEMYVLAYIILNIFINLRKITLFFNIVVVHFVEIITP